MIKTQLFNLFPSAHFNFSDYFNFQNIFVLFCCVKEIEVHNRREINSNFLVYILASQNSLESKISESQICDLVRSLFKYNDGFRGYPFIQLDIPYYSELA